MSPSTPLRNNQPMIDWCTRNGLDPTRIPYRAGGITIGTPPEPDRPCTGPCRLLDGLYAHVWHVLCEDDLPFTAGPDVVRHQRFGVGVEVEYLRCVPVDSLPPLPEAAVFAPRGDIG